MSSNNSKSVSLRRMFGSTTIWQICCNAFTSWNGEFLKLNENWMKIEWFCFLVLRIVFFGSFQQFSLPHALWRSMKSSMLYCVHQTINCLWKCLLETNVCLFDFQKSLLSRGSKWKNQKKEEWNTKRCRFIEQLPSPVLRGRVWQEFDSVRHHRIIFFWLVELHQERPDCRCWFGC